MIWGAVWAVVLSLAGALLLVGVILAAQGLMGWAS